MAGELGDGGADALDLVVRRLQGPHQGLLVDQWVAGATADTFGLYDGQGANFYLHFSNTPGPADLSRLRAPPYPRGRRVRLVDPAGQVLAVAESDGVGTLKLLRVLAHGDLPPERHFDD